MSKPRELAVAIFALSKRSWRSSSRQTAELTESEFLVLDVLSEKTSATVGEIISEVQVLPAQMSRILQRLQDQRLVEAGFNPQDKRKRDITITESGRNAHRKYQDAKLAPIIAALERLSAEEQTQFLELVHKMVS